MISNLGNLKSNDKNPTKRKLHTKMIKQALIIATKYPIGKCTKQMIDEYKLTVDEYYKLFPNKIAQLSVNQKITRLRSLVK